ncbi:MAG: iron ABC transporter permease [Oscillospiraceae bacterium]|jgi:iron complex transport system permease protein|nr:iron ABC transporter permease [Oscillospiraceae bacterium]
MGGISGKWSLALTLGMVLIALAALVMVISVSLGAMRIPPGRVAGIMWAKLANPPALSLYKANEIAVVWEIRLPRTLAGLIVGAGLAAAGAVFQSLLNNPLADPYTLGVSTGAAFGASLAIYMNLAYGARIPTVSTAFICAAAALLAVLFLAERGGGLVASNLIVAGMIVSAILSSAISFIRMLAGENVGAIVTWMMGSLTSRSWADIATLAPITAIGVFVAWLFSNELDLMTLGDRSAASLGVSVRRARLTLLLCGAAITAVCVAVSGVIGFVGLIVPHMLRMAVGSVNRRLIPLSAAAGGLLLMLADDAARLIGRGETPVGVLTTLLGGPFFLYLFLKRKT